MSKLKAIEEIDKVLCVGLIDRAERLKAQKPAEATASAPSLDPELKAKVEDLIAKRAEAKKNKDFSLADQIRGELLDMGIVIKDTREGTIYTLAE